MGEDVQREWSAKKQHHTAGVRDGKNKERKTWVLLDRGVICKQSFSCLGLMTEEGIISRERKTRTISEGSTLEVSTGRG